LAKKVVADSNEEEMDEAISDMASEGVMLAVSLARGLRGVCDSAEYEPSNSAGATLDVVSASSYRDA